MLSTHIAGVLYIVGFFIGVCATQSTSMYHFVCVECVSVAMIALSAYIMTDEVAPRRVLVRGPECKG